MPPASSSAQRGLSLTTVILSFALVLAAGGGGRQMRSKATNPGRSPPLIRSWETTGPRTLAVARRRRGGSAAVPAQSSIAFWRRRLIEAQEITPASSSPVRLTG